MIGQPATFNTTIHKQHLYEQPARHSAHGHVEIEEEREILVRLADGMIGPNRESAAGVARKKARQPVRFKPSVRIQDNQQVAGRGLCALVTGPRLAAPAVGQRLRRDHSRAQFPRLPSFYTLQVVGTTENGFLPLLP